MNIPKVIHQTWRDTTLPPQLAEFRAKWCELHPSWECKLWTDASALAFVAEHYPWFLDVYKGYDAPIKRVDAVRYLWLHHFGGVYVDLDIEPLQALDPLLAQDGSKLSFATEPETHCALYDKQFILSNAFISCPPNHALWPKIIAKMTERRDWADPLSATGPFLLTDIYESDHAFRDQVRLFAPPIVNPFDKFECWAAYDNPGAAGLASRAPAESVAIHHWLGSWWRE